MWPLHTGFPPIFQGRKSSRRRGVIWLAENHVMVPRYSNTKHHSPAGSFFIYLFMYRIWGPPVSFVISVIYNSVGRTKSASELLIWLSENHMMRPRYSNTKHHCPLSPRHLAFHVYWIWGPLVSFVIWVIYTSVWKTKSASELLIWLSEDHVMRPRSKHNAPASCCLPFYLAFHVYLICGPPVSFVISVIYKSVWGTKSASELLYYFDQVFSHASRAPVNWTLLKVGHASHQLQTGLWD
jgi:hypothetical protein